MRRILASNIDTYTYTYAYSQYRSQSESSWYIAFSWSGWGVCLLIFTGLIFLGEGGWIKQVKRPYIHTSVPSLPTYLPTYPPTYLPTYIPQLLELPFWAPLARLSYSAYLVHPMIILTVLDARGGNAWHFSLLNLFADFMAYASMTGIATVILYLLVSRLTIEVDVDYVCGTAFALVVCVLMDHLSRTYACVYIYI